MFACGNAERFFSLTPTRTSSDSMSHGMRVGVSLSLRVAAPPTPRALLFARGRPTNPTRRYRLGADADRKSPVPPFWGQIRASVNRAARVANAESSRSALSDRPRHDDCHGLTRTNRQFRGGMHVFAVRWVPPPGRVPPNSPTGFAKRNLPIAQFESGRASRGRCALVLPRSLIERHLLLRCEQLQKFHWHAKRKGLDSPLALVINFSRRPKVDLFRG